MNTNLQCPYCKSRTIETVKKVWYMQGFIYFVRYGAKEVVACKKCAQRRIFQQFILNFFFGWWCFPWGIGNPLVLIQNILAFFVNPSESKIRESLQKILTELGIQFDDIEIDDQGFSKNMRLSLTRLAIMLNQAINADNIENDYEIEQAKRILILHSGNILNEENALLFLKKHSGLSLKIADITYEDRISLLQVAIYIVGADGYLSDSERLFISSIGKQLNFPSDFVEKMLKSILFGEEDSNEYQFDGNESENEDNGVALARKILNVRQSATLSEIKKSYRDLILIYHPDVANRNGIDYKQAEETTKRLNWAYKLLQEHILSFA